MGFLRAFPKDNKAFSKTAKGLPYLSSVAVYEDYRQNVSAFLINMESL